MKTTLAIGTVALLLMSSAAIAGERPADAALGALSGAVVFGPIGAVAGAVVGYTAGPSISHSWRTRHARRLTRQQPRTYASNSPQVPRSEPAPTAASPIPPEPPAVASPAPPPVQGFE